MADLRAVVQHLGTRVLGESFDIDEWQPPAELVERINKPSAEIEAVRSDFASALTAIAERVAEIERRMGEPTADQSLVIKQAVRETVDARLAAMPRPEAVAVPLEAAAIADHATRLEAIERVVRDIRDREPSDASSLTERVEAIESYFSEALEQIAGAQAQALRQIGEVAAKMGGHVAQTNSKIDAIRRAALSLQAQLDVSREATRAIYEGAA